MNINLAQSRKILNHPLGLFFWME